MRPVIEVRSYLHPFPRPPTPDFGPNTTTFIIPAEIYPTDVRATCHGISAAFGKAGAAVGAAGFLKLSYMYCPGRECTKTSPAEQVDKVRTSRRDRGAPAAHSLPQLTHAQSIHPHTQTQHQGIRVVFICCTVLAALGLLWTWALVDDTPHDSLKVVEAVYGIEPEHDGEVAALEMTVAKGHAKDVEEGKFKDTAPISQ